MRYKCVVSYVGDHYEGWQSQTRGTSVQEQIEKVLEKNDEILASSLDQQTLNYYGYKQIKLSDTELKECQDYKNIKQSNYACGFNSYISETDGLNAESNETISFYTTQSKCFLVWNGWLW